MTFTTKSLTAIALTAGIAATGASAQQATFGMVDTDADGFLSEAELTTAFGDVGMTLLRYDLDTDGQLSPQEIEAHNSAQTEGDGEVVPSNVDEILEKGKVGDGESDEADPAEEDEFGGTAEADGDAERDEDNGDDEFGNLENAPSTDIGDDSGEDDDN